MGEMTRVMSLVALLLLVQAACMRTGELQRAAGPRIEHPDSAADSAAAVETVEVAGPMIVAFLPPMTDEQLEHEAGASESVAHVEFALADAERCLRRRAVEIRRVFATHFVLVQGGHRTSVRIPGDWPRSVGAYLLDPGRRPCVVYATGGPSSLQILLPHAAGEYFAVPACLDESVGRICGGSDGHR
jgi:hypothetical protein